MKNNHFVFADLSTYNLPPAIEFYSAVFGWSFPTSEADYLIAQFNDKEVSGLYETPSKFKDMNMPSFWMSYIKVENIDEVLGKVKRLGGFIEVVDKNQAIGEIALLRDPLGAGFTIYQGDYLNSKYEGEENALVWNELFVSDFSKIAPFYTALFDWKYETTDHYSYFINDSNNNHVGAIQEVSNNLKGAKEYWSVFFGVKDITKIKSRVLQYGGSLLYEDANYTLVADPFGAFFHLTAV